MGRLNNLVKQAIASRVKLMSQSSGSLGSGLLSQDRPIAPLLQGDFVLRFIGNGMSLDSTDFLLTGITLPGAALSWSPHGSVYGVPMPSVQTDYLSITFYISGDADFASKSFPSLMYYNEQFSSDGLLRAPVQRNWVDIDSMVVGPRATESARAAAETNRFNNDADVFGGFGGGSIDTVDTDIYIRPSIALIALCPNSDITEADEELELCRFTRCVFGTPTPSPNPSGVSPMSFTQQIGYQFIKWNVGSLLGKDRTSAMKGSTVYPMVSSAK